MCFLQQFVSYFLKVYRAKYKQYFYTKACNYNTKNY